MPIEWQDLSAILERLQKIEKQIACLHYWKGIRGKYSLVCTKCKLKK